MISLAVLLLVFLLIAVRQVGRIRQKIWQIMLLGAIAVLVTGQISPLGALEAVNPDVMLFLFGMFVVGEALEESGYLSHLSHRLFGRARSLDSLDKLGLTVSSRTKKDRRLRKVSLTDKGLDLLEKSLPMRREIFTQATSCLDDDEGQELREMLGRMYIHMLELLGKNLESESPELLTLP